MVRKATTASTRPLRSNLSHLNLSGSGLWFIQIKPVECVLIRALLSLRPPPPPAMATFTLCFSPVAAVCDHTIDLKGNAEIRGLLRGTRRPRPITPSASKPMVFHVSSHYLRLASLEFRAALTGI